MNFFPSLPWSRGRFEPILNSFVVDRAENGNNSNSRSPLASNPSSEDLSSADIFPENDSFAALPAVSDLSYVLLASTLVARFQYNCLPIAALAEIHQQQCFHVPSLYASIEGCAAGVLVLAIRADLTPKELTAEAILTFLWIMKSFNSQYGSKISTVISGFTELLGLSEPQNAALQKSMIAFQRQFLARLDWKIRLDDTEELKYAFKILLTTPGVDATCSHIKCEAMRLSISRLESKQQVEKARLAKAGANSTREAVAPSFLAPYLHVPVQFSASRILGPASFSIVSSPILTTESFITPAVSHRSYPSSLSPLNRDTHNIEEEEDYSLSDSEDIYSDEIYEDEEKEEDFLAAGTAAADAALEMRAPLLRKRQRRPWGNRPAEEPPRKKLIFTTETNSRASSSSGFFEAMRRPFLRAFQVRN